MPSPGSNWEYRIRDLETGEICNTGEHGEIEIKSSLRMFNYWHERHLPAMEWMKMGDIGYVDQNNYLYVIGRIKSRITLANAIKTNSTIIEDMILKGWDFRKSFS